MKMKKFLIAAGITVLTAAAGVGGWLSAKNASASAEPESDWYSEEGTEFVITEASQLYEMALLSFDHDFAGQTFLLGNDIVMNEGVPADWEGKMPENIWKRPIFQFAGTFDGQGHSIKGVYAMGGYCLLALDDFYDKHPQVEYWDGKTLYMPTGLFAYSKDSCVIKNLNVTDSIFYNWSNNGGGSIISNGAGTLDTVYSNATIVAYWEKNGGLVGVAEGGAIHMENCWFDGQVLMKGPRGSYSGGLIGAVKKAAETTSITHCLCTAVITNEFTIDEPRVGGFAGIVFDGGHLLLEDSLSTSSITALRHDSIGSAVGRIEGNATLAAKSAYSNLSGYPATLGYWGGQIQSYPIGLVEGCFDGEEALAWTDLDFESFWTIVPGSTPALRVFADETDERTSAAKAYDISWYDQGKAEYTLTTLDQLYGFYILSAANNFSGRTVKLGADITVNTGNAQDWSPKNMPANPWYPINRFAGTFDGQGHTISGVYLYSNQPGTGLFTSIANTGLLTGFRLENSSFLNTSQLFSYMGSIVGCCEGTVDTVYSNAIMESSATRSTGGIVGSCRGTDTVTINNCWFDGSITLTEGTQGSQAGGIAGNHEGPVRIRHCLNSGSITGGVLTGGIMGIMGGTVFEITDCLSVGSIPAEKHAGSIAGWLGARSTLTFENTYASAESCIKTLDNVQSDYVGGCMTIPEELLKGENAYMWTMLDFDEYWAIREGGTPVLRSFAKTVPSTAGLTKKMDTSWYSVREKEYVLNSAQALYGFAYMSYNTDFARKTVKLGKDITINTGSASSWEKNAPESPWFPIYGFAGDFNGQGHTVSGLYMKQRGDDHAGMFAKVNGNISRLRLTNSYFEKDGPYLGSIAGMFAGNMDHVYSNATVKATCAERSRFGGLVASVSGESSFTECWFDGTVDAVENRYVGGILACMENKTKEVKVSHCLCSGTLTARDHIAGICGYIIEGNIKIDDCLSIGSLSTIGSTYGTLVGGRYSAVPEITVTNSAGVGKGNLTGTAAAKSVTNSAWVNSRGPEKLKGADGMFLATWLKFEDHWVIRDNNTPALRSFSSGGTLQKLMDGFRSSAVKGEDGRTLYTVSSADDLTGFALYARLNPLAGATVKLANDITVNNGNASDWEQDPPENNYYSIGSSARPFAGIFDGAGHTISGIYQKAAGDEPTGLFAQTKDAVIKDLRVENSYFEKEGPYCGSVAGIFSGKMDHVYSNATVKATGKERSRFAGLAAGVTGDSSFNECWFDGTVDAAGNRYAGGIIGSLENGCGDVSVTHCLFTGSLKALDHGAGICGYLVDGNITVDDSLSIGTLNVEGATIGTIVGGRYSAVPEIVIRNSAGVGTKDLAGTAAAKEITNSAKVNSRTRDDLKGGDGFFLAAWIDFDDHYDIRDEEVPALVSLMTKKSSLRKAMDAFLDGASEDADGDTVYTISNADELYTFALLARRMNFAGSKVKLAADINVNPGWDADGGEAADRAWTGIGSVSLPFAGTFDGRGHTIKGLYQNIKSEDPTGLFAKTAGDAVIKDLRIENSLFIKNGPYCGSVAGIFSGKMERVYSSAAVKAADTGRSRFGGLAGAVTGSVKIDDCWFAGTVDAAGNQFVGGLLGSTDNGTSTAKVTNSMFSGKLTAKDQAGGICGYVVDGNITIEDSLYIGSLTVELPDDKATAGTLVGGRFSAERDIIIRRSVGVGSQALSGTAAAKEQTASAKINSRTRSELKGADGLFLVSWLDFDEYYVIRDNSYPALRTHCETGSLQQAMEDFEKGAETDETGKSVYTINNADDLYTFALVSRKTDFAGATVKLAADIDLNPGWDAASGEAASVSLTSAGSAGVPFAGTFDGQGHTLSGLYQNIKSEDPTGLFGVTAQAAVIKDLRIENSLFIKKGPYLGSVAGIFSGKMEKVYSSAGLKAEENGRSRFGGLAGAVTGTVDITECWFDGTVDAAGNQFVGGLFGSTDNGTGEAAVTHSMFSGVLTAKDQAGGICGYVVDGNITIEDALSIGTLSYEAEPDKATVGTLVGGRFSAERDIIIRRSAGVGAEALAGSAAAKEQTDSAKINSRTREQLTGGNGLFLNTWIDFEEHYMIRDEDVPALISLDKETSQLRAAMQDFLDSAETDGEGKSVYTINNKDDMYIFALLTRQTDFADCTVRLAADLDMNPGWDASTEEAPENEWTIISTEQKPFAGTFDGQGHTLRGVYVKANTQQAGMFAVTTATSTIKDLKLVNSCILTTAPYAGGIAGTFAGRAERIYSNAIIHKTTAGNSRYGGLFGAIANGDALIDSCWFDGAVNAYDNQYAGGLIGSLDNYAGDVTVRHSGFSGEITALDQVGGICGYLVDGNIIIEDSLFIGTMTAEKATVGTLVGGRYSATPEITIRNSVGVGNEALAGTAAPKEVTNSAKVNSRTREDLKGDAGAFLATWIDFEDHWITREGDVPAPQYLVDGFHNKYTEDGSGRRTYTIENAEELIAFAKLSKSRNFENCTVKLAADADLNPGWDAATETEPETAWVQIGSASVPFAGTFDGGGHTVRGLYMNTSAQRAGMFVKTAESAVLRDFRLENSCFVTTAAYAGCVAGSFSGTAEQIYVNAILHKTTSGNSRYGGFFGNIEGSSAALSLCWFDGSISAAGNSYVGGLIGDLDTACDVTVAHCLFTGSITASQQVGGICGIAFASGSNITFNDTLSAGSISASQSGGLIGSRQTAESVITANDSVSIGAAKWYGSVGAYTANNADNVNSKTLDDLKGDGGAFLDTWLDFEEYWTVRGGEVPALKALCE